MRKNLVVWIVSVISIVTLAAAGVLLGVFLKPSKVVEPSIVILKDIDLDFQLQSDECYGAEIVCDGFAYADGTEINFSSVENLQFVIEYKGTTYEGILEKSTHEDLQYSNGQQATVFIAEFDVDGPDFEIQIVPNCDGYNYEDFEFNFSESKMILVASLWGELEGGVRLISVNKVA